MADKVVVVGGGIAGLTAAYRLKQSGIDVELYEARGRVGGRIFTAQLKGLPVELGAQNIEDGGEAIHFRRLIDEFGLPLYTRHIALKHTYFTGQDFLPVGELRKEKSFDPEELRSTIDDLVLRCANMKEVIEHLVDPESALYRVIAVRMAAYEGGSIETLSPLYGETLFQILLGGICAAHPGQGEDMTFVDLVSVQGGNSLLPQILQNRLGANVHLQMPLTKVGKTKGGGYVLTFQNGEEVRADIVVLAIPCSVYESIAFEAEVIPAQKLAAIRNVQYGQNAKIIISSTGSPSETPEVLLDDEKIAFFDSTGLLTIYYTGASSFFSAETVADTYGRVRPLLEKGYGSSCPPFRVPEYAKEGHAYEGSVGYSWPNDPFARGTYSYIAAGQEAVLTATERHGSEIFKALFAPIENLYFAGEHASLLSDVPGTMEAACESGERVARAIIQSQPFLRK